MGVESPAGDFRICWVNTLSAKLGCSRKHLTMDFGGNLACRPDFSRALCGGTASQAGPGWRALCRPGAPDT
jgi:hypothetical protein